jgi:hypothetical protein
VITIPRDKTDEKVLIDEGRYLIKITNWRHDERESTLDIEYQFIHGPAGWNGKKANERFFTDPTKRSINKLAVVFKRLGAVDRGTPAEDANYDPMELLDKYAVVDITHREVTSEKSKTSYTVSEWAWGGVYPPDDSRVSEYMREHPLPGTAAAQKQMFAPAAAGNYDDL